MSRLAAKADEGEEAVARNGAICARQARQQGSRQLMCSARHAGSNHAEEGCLGCHGHMGAGQLE